MSTEVDATSLLDTDMFTESWMGRVSEAMSKRNALSLCEERAAPMPPPPTYIGLIMVD